MLCFVRGEESVQTGWIMRRISGELSCLLVAGTEVKGYVEQWILCRATIFSLCVCLTNKCNCVRHVAFD